MLGNGSATAILVHLAALTYVAGFLISNQMILRGLILIGTGFYIAYYYLEPATPLWDAIFWSVVMGLANGFTMIRLMLDRRRGAIPESDLAIHNVLPGLSAGDFQRMMALVEETVIGEDTVVIRAGTVPEHVYFVVSGEVLLRPRGENSVICVFGRSHFVGAAPYILGRAASATVTLGAGGRVMRWKTADLRALAARTESVRAALDAAFSRDLAVKTVAH